jgi:signal transduction histidine kinase
LRILVIEDEEPVRESYVDMLEFFDYKVVAVRNGREAIARINQEEYDIVLTDLNMPEINGLEVLAHIKKKKPYVEVIVITGYGTLENAVHAMKVGAYDFLTKPVEIEHVRVVLSKCARQILARKENEKLRSVNTRLKELNELKDKFITITNHEMRTPITVLKGYLELLNFYLEGNEDTDLNESLQIVNETMHELVEIVEHMHDFSSFDFGKKPLHLEDISVQHLLYTIVREMKVLFEKRNIGLQFSNDERDVTIQGDQSRLKRTIREIVQNALKFTPEGGRVMIGYSYEPAREQVMIYIRDTGIGIPADKHDLIFEPFYEIQNSINHTTSKTDFMGGGIGLGLTLAREVVMSHDGTIQVESEEGSGTKFVIHLPLAPKNVRNKDLVRH